MLQLCSLLPVNKLAYDKLNDYHLILAHINNKQYIRHFRDDTRYKILDNSAFELGRSVPDHQLFAQAKEMDVAAVFIPEVFNDERESVKLRSTFDNRDGYTEYHCIHDHVKPDAEKIAIPADLDRIKYLKEFGPLHGVYLSGTTIDHKITREKLVELVVICNMFPKETIRLDTSLPFLMTMEGEEILDVLYTGRSIKLPHMDFEDKRSWDLNLYERNFWQLKTMENSVKYIFRENQIKQ